MLHPAMSAIVEAMRRLTVSPTTGLIRSPEAERPRAERAIGLVQARPVDEHAFVFSETLAVIRDEDDPGPIQCLARSSSSSSRPDSLVDRCDALVIAVDDERQLLRRDSARFVQGPPAPDQLDFRVASTGFAPKRRLAAEGVDKGSAPK